MKHSVVTVIIKKKEKAELWTNLNDFEQIRNNH